MLNAYRLKNNLFNNPWAKSFFCIGRHCLDFLPTVKRAVSFRRVWKGKHISIMGQYQNSVVLKKSAKQKLEKEYVDIFIIQKMWRTFILAGTSANKTFCKSFATKYGNLGFINLTLLSYPYHNFHYLRSKWKYWNRPKIENRNGASQKTFSYTFCRNHFLNKYLCVRLSACGYRKKRKDERFHHRVSVGELEVLPVHLESFYNSMRWDLPTQRRVRNAMVTWHLKQETILKSQKSEVSCGK
ncbi:unnamed protein product [Nesidiocoris tenuis]|uniref:Uncharacterized protein n=1 Tax=Nesidiocoris tenuis TaxID=355587 RepID=A0A6H5GZ58_9HEMI|nr:unnamed protein product [Nesidiocoris tenuis]